MISPGNAPDPVSAARIDALKAALNGSKKYWPITPKQLFYLLVTRGQLGRTLADYTEFNALLTAALQQGLLPAPAVWEPTGLARLGGAWENTDEFIRAEVDDFLWGYRRNLLQGQPRYIELWLGSPELLDFFSAITVDYCVSTVVCPASPGLGFFNDLRRRLADLPSGRSGLPGQKPEVVVLYFGDFNPNGPDDLVDLQRDLRARGNIWDITLERIALTRKIVLDRSLPSRVSVSAAEQVIHPGTPPLAEDTVELEALEPKMLAALVRRAIESRLDMHLFENQKELQDRELSNLTRLRADVLRRLKELLPPS